MEMHCKRDRACTKICFCGELGHHEASEAVKYIENTVDLYTPMALELDLSGLTFMDSSGIAVVMAAYRNIRDIGGKTWLKNVPEQPMKVLTAAGVNKIVRVVNDADGGIHT